MADYNISELLEKSSDTDLPLLLRTKEELKKQVKDNPSQANLNALDRTNRMLEAKMAEKTENQRTFKDNKAILLYLKEQNRKIEKTKLYADIKQGLLRRQSDKSFRKKDVDIYAQTLSLVVIPEKEADETSRLALRKSGLESKKLEEQIKSIAFDRSVKEGKYILRQDVEIELAGRAAILAQGLKNAYEIQAYELIKLVKGDINMLSEFIAKYEQILDENLNEYSKPISFEVEFEFNPQVLADDQA